MTVDQALADVHRRFCAKNAHDDACVVLTTDLTAARAERDEARALCEGAEANRINLANQLIRLERAIVNIRAFMGGSCWHCGRLPDEDGDHSCACPKWDGECDTHTLYPVVSLTALRALLPTDATSIIPEFRNLVEGAAERESLPSRPDDLDRLAARRDALGAGPTLRRVPNKPPMVMRSLRVPLPLWEAALAVAVKRQENVSDVIREALERYVKRG